MKIKTQGLKNLWDSIKAVLRGSACIYSNTSLPQETRKTWNRQPNFTPKTTAKRTKTPKISRRQEIIKIRAEINEKEMKETIVKN